MCLCCVCRLRTFTVMHRWSVGFIVNGALQSSWWWWWWTGSLEIWHVWMCDYVNSPTPHAKYGGRRKWGWSIFFGYFNASTAYPEKRGFSLSWSKNVFRWWVCSFGVDLPRGSNLPFFAPKKHFSVGRIRLSFCMGVNNKHPLWLMIAV